MPLFYRKSPVYGFDSRTESAIKPFSPLFKAGEGAENPIWEGGNGKFASHVFDLKNEEIAAAGFEIHAHQDRKPSIPKWPIFGREIEVAGIWASPTSPIGSCRDWLIAGKQNTFEWRATAGSSRVFPGVT
jgi:hypothetical protein